MSKKKSLLIIDSDSIFYIIMTAFKSRIVDGKISRLVKVDMKLSADRFIKRILHDAGNPEEFLGFYGKTGTGNFRDDIAVTKKYKGNRPPKPPELIATKKVVSAAFDDMGFIAVEGREADDDVCFNADYYKELLDEEGNHVYSEIILSFIDKDLIQILPSKDGKCPVKFHNYRNFSSKFSKNTIENPENYIRWGKLVELLINGDTADGFIGIPGYGKKKVAEIVKGCVTPYSFFRATAMAYYKAFKYDIPNKSIKKIIKEAEDSWRLKNNSKRLTKEIKKDILVELEDVIIAIREFGIDSNAWKYRFTEIYRLAKLPSPDIEPDIEKPIKNPYIENSNVDPTVSRSLKDILDNI